MHLKCDICGHMKIRIDYCDSDFCLACNEWKNEKCSDPNCKYCPDRSEKPFTEEEVIWLKTWMEINPEESLEDHIDEHCKSFGKY